MKCDIVFHPLRPRQSEGAATWHFARWRRAGHHLLSWWGVRASQAANLRQHTRVASEGGRGSGGGGGVNKERNRPSISSIDLLLTAGRAGERPVTSADVVWPQQQHRTRLRRRPCPTRCAGGTCFYYYRSDTVMCQKAERVLQRGLVTDDGRRGKVAERLRWHLI